MIKALFAEKRFAYAPIDLGKQGSGNRLGQILQSHQLTIDTAYVSNVWLHLKDQVQTLPDRSASEMDFEMQEDVESGDPHLKNYLKNIHSFKASLTQSINIIYATRVYEGSFWQLQELGQVISDGGQYPRNFIYARPATE